MARVFLIDATAVPRQSPFIAQPIGLLSLAAVLRRAGHRVAVHDCKIDVAGLPGRLCEFAPDLVGIRAVSPFLNVLGYLREMLSGLLPGVPVIVGGPHANAAPEHAIRYAGAACAVLGEGEETLLELVEPLLDGASLRGIRGLAFLDEEETLVVTDPRPPIEDLDSLPMPAWDLIPMELYFSLHHAGTAPSGRTVTVFTSRGCPYHCAFCHNIFGKRFRGRSAEAVLDEFRYLHRTYGVEELEIHDDSFNTDRDRLIAVCQGLQRVASPMLLAFPNGLRGDLLPRDVLVELALAGTHHMALSPETASPRLQKLVGKRMNLDRLAEAAAICDELRVLTVGYFMLGFPTETEEEMEATVRWACASPLHTASFFNVVAFPGTRLYSMAVAEGLAMDQWQNARYFEGTVNFSAVPDDRFQEIWTGAYRRFYLSPHRALRIWRAADKGVLLRNGCYVAARLLRS